MLQHGVGGESGAHIYFDQGESWAALAIVGGQYWSNLFVRDDGVYLLGTSSDGYAGEGSIAISRSTDSGVTWRRQVLLRQSLCWLLQHGAAYTQRGSASQRSQRHNLACLPDCRSSCQPQTQQQAAMRRVPRRCWCRTAACGGDWSCGQPHTGRTVTAAIMQARCLIRSLHGRSRLQQQQQKP